MLSTPRGAPRRTASIHGPARFERAEDGWWQVERLGPSNRAGLIDRFRLPTEDEWEYLADAGGRTLFRWGNACPRTSAASATAPNRTCWRPPT